MNAMSDRHHGSNRPPKLLADRVDGKQMSRAVAGRAASIGISGALSFSIAPVLAEYGSWPLPHLLRRQRLSCSS